MIKKSISDIVNTEYISFSKYVVFQRAIPHLIDGFKPVARKAFYCAKNKTKFTKVLSMSGEMILANYHHGDTSASAAVSAMAQDFPGSNNIPVFLKNGSFGNRFITAPSAPRYIEIKPNPFYYSLYNDNFLHVNNDDPDNPEPQYYLPIIPTILLNGIKGIAVGFATEFQPYNIHDIIEIVEKFIKKEEHNSLMTPYYKGYNGTIGYDNETRKFMMFGEYKILNTTTIHITEIPVNMDREKYITHLNKLIDKNLIKSFEDNSKNSWDIKINLARNSKVFDDPETYLKLRFILNENLTVVDQNNKIRVFNDAVEIIEEFVKFRLNVYSERRKYMLAKLKEDMLYAKSKINFIKMLCNINFKTMTKSQIYQLALDRHCNEEHLKRHMTIQVHSLNLDEIEKIKQQMIEIQTEYNWYKKITNIELYEIDLKNLKEKLNGKY